MASNSFDFRGRSAGEARNGAGYWLRRGTLPALQRRSRRRVALDAILASTSALALALAVGPAAADEIIDGGQTITVPGDKNSPWNVGGDLIVGNTGVGTLIIVNGGIVDNASGIIGETFGSLGTVMITGPLSAWNNSVALTVGHEGEGHLTISGFAGVETDFLMIAESNVTGTITVSGQGSALTVNSLARVGFNGDGTVRVEDGGTVINLGELVVGSGPQATGAVVVSGQDSIWFNSGEAEVGASGTGSLTIENGGTFLSSGDVILASEHAANGSTGIVGVSGQGSGLTVDGGALVVGREGTGILTVEDGATVAVVANQLLVGETAGISGSVTVDGAGSTLTYGTLEVGVEGAGELIVRNGATVGSAINDIVLGSAATGQANVTVTGAGSVLTTDILRAGHAGTATVTVTEGGLLQTGIGIVGSGAGSTGSVNLSGTGTIWANTLDDIYIGFLGEGEVTVSDGAAIDTVSYVRLGNETGSSGSLTLTGAGSSLDAGLSIEVGKSGTGFVSVEDGASVVHGLDLLIGQASGAMGLAIVSGEGSSWQVMQNATIGESGMGTFIVADGASATIGQDTVLGSAGGSGVLWADGGTISTNTLTVGETGNGTLVVEEGGAISVGGGAGTIFAATQAGSNGDIGIGNGGAAGTIAAERIVFGDGDGHLFFAHTSTDYVFNPILEGSATIEHLFGDTILTADSSAFTGSTSVTGGILTVNGILGGTMGIEDGAVLAGTGAVGTVTVASGGTVAPGNSIGTLNVGDITFDVGSLYEVEVDDLGNSDLVNAAGVATVNGGTVNVIAYPDIAVGTAYTILTASGGVTGTFDGVTFASDSIFVTPTLTYDASNAYLTLAITTDFPDVALTPNQKASAAGIQSVGAGELLSAIALLGSVEEARQAFDAISGEVHASIKGAMLEDSRFVRDAATARVRAAFDDVAAPSPPVLSYGEEGSATAAADGDRLAVWAQAFGAWGRIDGDGNAATLDRNTGGVLIGADTLVFESWRVGILAGYSRSSYDVDDRASSGDSDNLHLGLYGGSRWGNVGLRLGAAYSWHDVDTDRSVAFSGFADNLEASYDAGTGQIFGELGYRIDAAPASIEPFAALAYANVHTDAFTEAGGAAALASGSSNTDATFTTLGVRTASEFTFDSTRVTATSMVGWRHAFGDIAPLAAFAFAGGDAFTIAGVPIARDSAIVEAGLNVQLTPRAAVGLSYNGQFGSGLSDHSARANVAVRF